VGDHEGPGVEVSVGDGVHLVDLGIVLYVEVVVACVGRKSFSNVGIRFLNILRLGSLSRLSAGEGGGDDLGLVDGGGGGGEAGVRGGGLHLKFVIDYLGVRRLFELCLLVVLTRASRDPVIRVNFSLSAGTGGGFGASGTLGIVIGVCRGLLSTGIIAERERLVSSCPEGRGTDSHR